MSAGSDHSRGRLNIVVVIADDMGVHQLGCGGSRFYETPHLDRLAAGGTRFACAYSTSPVCSPARASLYTGLHPARLHLTNFIPGTVPPNPRLLTPDWRPYLPVEVETLGDALKVQGYATGHFGKWHLAYDYNYEPGRPTDPESQGFDHVLVTRKPSTSADPEGDPHHIDRITDAAIRFIDRQRSQPFLCVIAHNALHRPELAPAALIGKYAVKPGARVDHQRPVLGAMVEQLDTSVGRLIAALHERGLERNTLVVFTADHGAFGRSSDCKPLRGAKADLYEGGVRVPLICSLPGAVAVQVRHEPVDGTDLFPTLLGFAGLEPAAGLDGRSFASALRDAATPVPAHAELCWHFPHYHHLGLAPSGAIRVGRHKLIEWFECTVGGFRGGTPYELYDLEADPSEEVNLADREPELCARLAQRLREWRRRIGAQEMVPNPAFDAGRGGSAAIPLPGDPDNPYSSK